MRRAHVVASLRSQKVARRAVDWDRVTGRLNRAEAEPPVLVGDELAPQVHIRLTRILVLVQTLARGVPDVDLGVRDRASIQVDHRARDEDRVTGGWRPHD